MSNLVDIVQGIINQIDLSLPVITTDGTTIDLCDTLHLTKGSTIEDGSSNQYLVDSFVLNESITVSPLGGAPALFAGTVVIAPAINFQHGSPASTNNEYQDLAQVSRDKLPLIWLLESYEYTDQGLESSIVANYDARLFFLELTYEEQWVNNEHNELAIKPMENLVRAFKDVIDNDYTFKRMDTFRSRVRPRFGVEIANQGSQDKIINEDLSGVEVNMTIELYDLSICNC